MVLCNKMENQSSNKGRRIGEMDLHEDGGSDSGNETDLRNFNETDLDTIDDTCMDTVVEVDEDLIQEELIRRVAKDSMEWNYSITSRWRKRQEIWNHWVVREANWKAPSAAELFMTTATPTTDDSSLGKILENFEMKVLEIEGQLETISNEIAQQEEKASLQTVWSSRILDAHLVAHTCEGAAVSRSLRCWDSTLTCGSTGLIVRAFRFLP